MVNRSRYLPWTRRHPLPLLLGLLAAYLVLLLAPPAAAQSFNRSLPLYVLDASNNLFRTVDPLTGATLTTVNIVDADGNVDILEGLALAVHPTTGQLFASLTVTGPSFVLATIDPSTDPAQATIIGPIMLGADPLLIADLTFAPDGTLYGVNTTSNAFPPASELVTINLTTAAAASVVSLQEFNAPFQFENAIAFNPEDNLIYHATFDGNTNQSFLQSLDPAAADVEASKLTVTLQGGFSDPAAMDYFGNNTLLLFDSFRNLFVVKAGGQVRFLSDVVVGNAGGVAFAGLAPACPPFQRLYGAANDGPDGPSLFYALDPDTAAATLIGPIGFERVGAMDFLSNGALIAIGETQDGNNTGTTIAIDPCTGLGTAIGPTGAAPFQDISADSSDNVFGSSLSSQFLATVDTGTGAAVTVNEFNPATADGGGLAFDPVNTLFLVTECNPDTVFSTVNPADATRTALTALGIVISAPECPRVNAMDFDPISGTLFGSLVDGGPGFLTGRRNFLVTIDTAFFDVVTVGPTQEGLDAIAFNSVLADLELLKVSDLAEADVGQTVTFTLTVTNNGPAAATNVVVEDTLPAGFMFDTVTPSVGNCAGANPVVCTIASLADAASATIVIVGSFTSPGTLDNTATVTADQADPDTANNSATAGVLVGDLADLEIIKVADPPRAVAGDLVTFTLTITNNGPGDATNVVVFDDFTASNDFAIDSTTPSQGTCMDFLTCELGDLLNGDSATIEIVVTTNLTGSLPNTATVSADQTDTDQINDSSTATITPSVADLAITKAIAPGQALVGDEVTFTLTITNLGPDTATNVAVTDILSDDFILDSSDPSQGTCTGFLTCELGSLASGASATVEVTLTAGVAGLLSNTASVAAAQDDPVAANNSATATVTVEEVPVFTLSVNPAGGSVLGRQPIVFSVTVATTQGTVGAVALSCVNVTGSPSITCAFDPGSVTPGTGTATSTLTVTPGALALLNPEPLGPSAPFHAALWLGLPGLALLGFSAFDGGRRRLAHALAMSLLLLALLLPLAGCNQGEQFFSVSFQVRGTLGATEVTSQVITVTVLPQ